MNDTKCDPECEYWDEWNQTLQCDWECHDGMNDTKCDPECEYWDEWYQTLQCDWDCHEFGMDYCVPECEWWDEWYMTLQCDWECMDNYDGECNADLVCDFYDCHDEETEDPDSCWREECYSDCGEYHCNVWHYEYDPEGWVIDPCYEEENQWEDA